MTTADRTQRAVDAEFARYAKAEANIDQAVADGRISASDGDERKARAEQWLLNRVAFIKGEPRPRQRQQRPLDDPNAGVVG